MNLQDNPSCDKRSTISEETSARWSIRTLLVWLVLACLLPGIIGASALFMYEYGAARAQLEKDTVHTARVLSQAVDHRISKIQALAEALSTSDSLLADDLARFHQQARRTLEKSGVGTVVSLTEQTGQQIVDTGKQFGTRLPVHGDLELIRRVFETGTPAVSDLFIGTAPGRPLVSVAVPVVREGKVVYALAISVLPEDFQSILTAQDVPDGWMATILDGSATVVARSQASETYMGQRPAPLFIERRGATEEGALEFVMQDGIPVLSAFTRSPATNWTVAVDIPLDSQRAQFFQRLSLMALGIATLFAVGIGLAWILGGKIARSIRELRAPAVALGDGHTLSIPSLDVKEVAEVTEALAKAAELLNERASALRASEEKYRTLFVNMNEGFILGEPILDQQGRPIDVRFLELNEAYHEQTGVPRDILGRPLRECLPQVEDIWIERYSAVAFTGQADKFDSYNVDTQRHYEVYAFCPSPGRFAVLGRDVTEQKRLETALRLAEARFRCLYEANLVGILIADVKGDIVETNDYYLNLVGHTRQEFEAGQVDWRTITPAEWLPADERALAEIAATGTCTPYEKEYLLRDGSLRAVFIAVVSLPEEDGLHLALVLDITDRRRAEKELERLNADLERQVRARTAELVQLQKMEAIGRLTGGIAHDFNNVLQGLASCLFVLERYVPDGTPRTLYESAKRSIESGGRLTQALLAFARRQTLVPAPIDLQMLFDNMAPLLQRTLGGLIRVEFEVEQGTPAALADRGQLESALLNLAINARDAMPSGGVLRLGAGKAVAGHDTPEELKSGEYVAICVEDTGTGMDEAILARVFEPFFTTKAFGKGSGLGLSMVHGMAVQSGGTVSIMSTPGHGTTVTLYLPKAKPSEKEAPGTQLKVESGNGSTVLLVDDNDLMRDALTMTLEAQGYRVLAAAGGSGALSILQDAKRIDALVTDYAMPGMNGAALAREARRLIPALPVLLITGYAEEFDDMDGIALLHKPFQTEALLTSLAAMLNG